MDDKMAEPVTPKTFLLENCFVCCDRRRHYNVYTYKMGSSIPIVSFLTHEKFAECVSLNENIGICTICLKRVHECFNFVLELKDSVVRVITDVHNISTDIPSLKRKDDSPVSLRTERKKKKDESTSNTNSETLTLPAPVDSSCSTIGGMLVKSEPLCEYPSSPSEISNADHIINTVSEETILGDDGDACHLQTCRQDIENIVKDHTYTVQAGSVSVGYILTQDSENMGQRPETSSACQNTGQRPSVASSQNSGQRPPVVSSDCQNFGQRQEPSSTCHNTRKKPGALSVTSGNMEKKQETHIPCMVLESDSIDVVMKEAVEQITSNQAIYQAVKAQILHDIRASVDQLVARSALTRYRGVTSLLENGNKLIEEIVQEISEKIPFLFQIFKTLVTPTQDPPKNKEANMAAAYAILMNARHEHLSAWHRMTTFVAIKGHLDHGAFNRLNHFGITLSGRSKLRLLEEAGRTVKTETTNTSTQDPLAEVTAENIQHDKVPENVVRLQNDMIRALGSNKTEMAKARCINAAGTIIEICDIVDSVFNLKKNSSKPKPRITQKTQKTQKAQKSARAKNRSQPPNTIAENSSQPPNTIAENSSQPPNTLAETGWEPPNTIAENKWEPQNTIAENKWEPQNTIAENKWEPQNTIEMGLEPQNSIPEIECKPHYAVVSEKGCQTPYANSP